jgi:hypothetical protein
MLFQKFHAGETNRIEIHGILKRFPYINRADLFTIKRLGRSSHPDEVCYCMHKLQR